MENEATSAFVNSGNDKLTLLTFDIKTESEDHPELIKESDLISDNFIKNENHIENILDSNTDSASNEPHRCPQCNEEFPEFKYIQVHEAVHNFELHCPVCDRIFKWKKYFVPHIQMHLKDPIKCQQCPEIFFDKRSYNLHLYTHRKTKTYTCEYCLKEWTNKKDLTVHIRVHTNERPYSCGICGKSFKQKGGLSSHISTLHSSEKKVIKEKYSCDICNGSYSSISSLNKHVRKIHEAGKTFPCRKCGETFLNFKQMKEHKRETHPELVYTRICTVCNEKFSCRESFAKHEHLHMGTEQKIDQNPFRTPLDCYLCGDQMQGMKAFSKHQQVHLLMTDEEIEACVRARMFNCKVCGKLFNFKKNLFRHMDVHLEKKFECENHCSEKFTYLGIRLHLEWYFEQFHCAECDETFMGRKSLKKHYKKHQATIKFSCKICGYQFRYRRLLLTHWKMQHNLKCHLCFKHFVTHLELRRHIKIKHKVNSCDTLGSVKIKQLENKVERQTQKYKCKVCKYPSETVLLLADHMKLHKKRCFQCENCKKNFLYFRNWMFHMRQNICLKYINNTNGMTRLSCFVCKKEFGTVHSLIIHMRRHTTIHKCKFCNSKFKQKDLQEHINRQHPGVVKYSCDKCGLRFCSLSDLVKHGRNSHRDVTIKEEPEELTTEYPQEVSSEPDENEIVSGKKRLFWVKQEPMSL